MTTFRTPAGRPASIASSATRRAVSEVCSAGLTIIEQPAASAGPIFQAIIRSGKFHGNTAPTTPMGSRTTSASASSPTGAVWSYSLSIASACQISVLMVSGRSISAQSRTGLPESSDSRTESSCRFRRSSFARRISTCLRAAGCWQRQRPSSNASRALPTAKSTSVPSQAATAAITSPVAGLALSKVAPLLARRNEPSTKAVVAGVRSAAMARYSSWVSSSDIRCLLRRRAPRSSARRWCGSSPRSPARGCVFHPC